jgi:hypothetical protein
VLSPTYDMLPMLYAPVASEIVPVGYALDPTATLAVWSAAVGLAQAFGGRTGRCPHLPRLSGDCSAEFEPNQPLAHSSITCHASIPVA